MQNLLLPGSWIGILGGGQLGRMLALEARRMGYRTITWTGVEEVGPAEVADVVLTKDFSDAAALQQFVEQADVVTVEFENIPKQLLEEVAAHCFLAPSAKIVSICQHREREKQFLAEHGLPCAPFVVVDSSKSLAAGMAQLGKDCILKTAEFGYDGKGQRVVKVEEDPAEVWQEFASPRAVLEEKIDLAGEISVLVARSTTGEVCVYDPAENFHANHILDLSLVPARYENSLLQQAQQLAVSLVESLDYVGVLAVEFFLSQDGRLLVNELAPRPHNSGHHTLDAVVTSQFEQQLRAICGLPLGSTALLKPVVMWNLLGDLWPQSGQPCWQQIFQVPAANLHLYGKEKAKVGRKMGHVNFLADSLEEAFANALECKQVLRKGRE